MSAQHQQEQSALDEVVKIVHIISEHIKTCDNCHLKPLLKTILGDQYLD